MGEDAIGSFAVISSRLSRSVQVAVDVILTVTARLETAGDREPDRRAETDGSWGSALFLRRGRRVHRLGHRSSHRGPRQATDPSHEPCRARRVPRADVRAPRGGARRRVADRSADELEVLESDFNKMAIELDAQRRQLERTHRLEAWSEMARQVAHEIKNPLTPVQLSAEHLLRVHADRGSPLSPVLQGCVDSILKQVRILRQIASEFSSYASSPVADLVPTALDALIEEVIGPYRPGLEGRIRVAVEVPTDLPMLRLDRRLMQRTLTNLIENALHAMPGDGALSISVVRHPAQLELAVTDTGIGVEPDVLARIFEPYFSTRVTGTGLGMAIAKRKRRAERWHDRGRERAGPGYDGHDRVAVCRGDRRDGSGLV